MSIKQKLEDVGWTHCLECGRLENILEMCRCSTCLRYRCQQCIHVTTVPSPPPLRSMARVLTCENHLEIIRD